CPDGACEIAEWLRGRWRLPQSDSCPAAWPRAQRCRCGAEDDRPQPESELSQRQRSSSSFLPKHCLSLGGLRVSNGGGNCQLGFCARVKLAPHCQLSTHKLGAFVHARQTVVAHASARIKDFRVNPLAVVPHAQAKLPLVIVDFHFDPPCL